MCVNDSIIEIQEAIIHQCCHEQVSVIMQEC